MESNIRTIREGLKLIADVLEDTDNTNKRKIQPRELTGDNIRGGTITEFSSVGIRDLSTRTQLQVSDEGIKVRYAAITEITSPTKVNGNLTILGNIFSDKITVADTLETKKLIVDELKVSTLKADTRVERSESLHFIADANKLSGKGLLWAGDVATKQFIYKSPDIFWSSENIDLHKDRAFLIDNTIVIDSNSLGPNIKKSNLQSLGKVKDLVTVGSLSIDNFIHYNPSNNCLGIGTSNPTSLLHLEADVGQFQINSTQVGYTIGSYTTTDLSIVTDDIPRIHIASTGQIILKKKVFVDGKLGIGVNNFDTEIDLATANAVSFQGKRFEVSDKIPNAGFYKKGDIVWNTNVASGNYIGWVCIKEGTPGQWKAFGQIQN